MPIDKSARTVRLAVQTLQKLPNLLELKEIVVQDLKTTIPVGAYLADRLYEKVMQNSQLGPNTGKVYFIEASSTEIVKLESVIWNVIRTDVSDHLVDGTEDRCHHISHIFLEAVWCVLFYPISTLPLSSGETIPKKTVSLHSKIGRKAPSY